MYHLTIRRSAKKELSSFPAHVVKRIVDRLEGLKKDPRPSGSKKLKGTSNDLWRIRVGDYRVVYTVYDEQKEVEVISMGHRKDIYK